MQNAHSNILLSSTVIKLFNQITIKILTVSMSVPISLGTSNKPFMSNCHPTKHSCSSTAPGDTKESWIRVPIPHRDYSLYQNETVT